MKKQTVQKFLCGLLVLILAVMAFPTKAFAATTYTSDALFSKFPSYLLNEESSRRMTEMIDSGVDILKAQSATDNAVAHLNTFVDDGVAIMLKDILYTLTESEFFSTQDQLRKEIAQNTLYRLANSEDEFITASNKAIKMIGGVKDLFKVTNENIEVAELCEKIDFSGLQITADEAKQVGETIYGKSDGNVIKIAGYAVDWWKVFVSVLELYEIELYTIDTLLEYAPQSSDLAIGLGLLRAERTANPLDYITATWLADEMVKQIASSITKITIEKAEDFFDPTKTIGLLHTGLKLFFKYGYIGASVTEQTKAYIAYSNVHAMSAALSTCQATIIKRGYAAESEKEAYRLLYDAYIGTIEEFLDQTLKLTTPGEYDLHGAAECNLETLQTGAYISYSIYLSLCTRQLNADIADGQLGADGELPEIGEQINAESIADRIAAVQERWTPNAGIAYSERYSYSVGSPAFARMVFHLLYGVDMPATTQNQYRYQLYGTQNVIELGLLRHTEFSLNAVKTLLSQALPGDVLIGYGGTSAHYMLITGVGDNGLTVYDCDSPYNG